jgi:hypothetical protein
MISDDQYAARLKALAKRKADLELQMANLTADLNMVEGAILETKYWINVTPEGAPQQAPLPKSASNGYVPALAVVN